MSQKLRLGIVIVILAIILIVVSPVLSNTTQAGSDWTNEALTEANVSIGKAGYNKKTELLERDIDEEVKKTLNPIIDQEIADLEKMLEDFYHLKLEGLTDTVEYQNLQEQIKTLKQSIFDRYSREIEAIFE